MNHKSKLIFCVTILLLLFAASVFRWENLSYEEKKGGVVQFKQDRWTGERWADLYGTGQNIWTGIMPTGPFNDKSKSEVWIEYRRLNLIWKCLVGLFLLLSFYQAIRLTSQKKKLEEGL
jgi:hypothetical protein